MEGDDEVLFTGRYRDFSLAVQFNLRGKNDGDTAFALASLSEMLEGPAFQLSGIDCAKVKKLADVKGSGINAALSFLSSQKPNELRAALTEAAKEALLLSVAETYFFNQVFEKAGVPYKIKPQMLQSTVKQVDDKPEDRVAFIGKHESWISIKKLSINEKTEPWEVSGILSGINSTLVLKALDFAKPNRNDALVSKLAGGKRKSYGNVAEALKGFTPSGNAIDDAYFVNKVMETLGYRPYAHPDMLTPAHPEIKGVKMRGRKPKG
jgi:hypothetical protein